MAHGCSSLMCNFSFFVATQQASHVSPSSNFKPAKSLGQVLLCLGCIALWVPSLLLPFHLSCSSDFVAGFLVQFFSLLLAGWQGQWTGLQVAAPGAACQSAHATVGDSLLDSGFRLVPAL